MAVFPYDTVRCTDDFDADFFDADFFDTLVRAVDLPRAAGVHADGRPMAVP